MSLVNNFIIKNNLDPKKFNSAFSFGDNVEMANKLGELVLVGQKTATSSSFEDYEKEGQTLQKVTGKFDIVLNGKEEPIAAIQSTQVIIVPFNEVTDKMAFMEGEGDRTLRFWKEAHETFYKRISSFNPKMLLVFEEFRVIAK